jgi:predicted MFS family arabinose efflux permease
VQVPTHGWTSAPVLEIGGLAVLLMGAFLALEARIANPIMPLRVFRVHGLLSTSAVRGLLFTGMYGVFFVGTLFLEHVRGFNALHTGFAYLPMTLVVLVFSSGITARLVRRFGPRRTLYPAMLCVVSALLLLAQIDSHSGYYPLIAIAFALMGAGMGASSVPLLTIALAEVPAADAGLASGVINVSMQVAGAIGVAVLGAVATDRTHTLLGLGRPLPAALTGGYHEAFVVASICVIASVLVAATVLRPRRRRDEAHAAVASRLEPSGERT